ncbi:hypothetical protein V1505DRAFT_386065 [Lipomyces doorenjongii]
MSVTPGVGIDCCSFVGADNVTTTYCAQMTLTAGAICETNGLFVNGSVPTSTSAAIKMKAGSMRAIIVLLMVLAIINTLGVSAAAYNVAEALPGTYIGDTSLCQR